MSARNRNNAERRPDPIGSLDTEHKIEVGKADRAAKVEGGDLEKANELVMQAQAKTAEALAELALIRGGQVGAENAKLTPVEVKKEGDLEKKVEQAEEKFEYAVDKTRVKKLEGNVDEQLKTLNNMWKEMEAEMKNTSSADLGLYKKLYKKGSTQDEFGKYSKISAKEQSRLSAFEGPVITSDVIKKMASGEMSWTMNGIYAAGNELRAGRLPATGSRPEAAPAGASIHEFPTGKKITPAEAAAAALAAAVLIESGETHEAPRNIEEASAEYDAALQEQKGLFEERENLKTDARILIDINETRDPVARMEMILKNMGMIAEYLQLFDASASVEKIQQMFPSFNQDEAKSFKNFIGELNEQDFYEKEIKRGLAFSGNDRILFIEKAFTNALAQSDWMFKKTNGRYVELKTKIAALEKELAAAKRLTPEQVLAKETNEAEAKLMEVSGRIKSLDKELNKARRLPQSAENDFRLVELTRTMKDLQAEKEKIRRRLDELNARGEKLAAEAAAKAASEAIEYSPANYAGGYNDEHERKEKEAAALEKEFPPGTVVKVERSDKTIEEGWQVTEVKDGKALVIIHDGEYERKHPGEFKIFKKNVPLSELKEWQITKTTAPAGKFERVEPVEVRPDRQLAADISESENQPSQNAKPSEREPVDRETETRETLKLAREILEVRKEAYAADIAAGNLSAAELRTIKEKLAAVGAEAAVEKVFTSSKTREFRIKPKFLNQLKPFASSLYDRLIIDTDALIALAEKTEAAAPQAAEPKRDVRAEKREAVAAVMAASREAIKTKANEAGAMDSKGLETAYKEINAPEGSKAVKKLLLDKGVLAASDVEKLSNDEIFALRNELAAVYLKEVGKRAAAKRGEKAEPKPAPKSPEREAAEKIVESAKTKFAARIEEVAGENIRTVEKLYSRLVNAKPEKMAEELTDILMNGNCLTKDERAKLTPADLNALRREAINICFEKINKKEIKKQPPKGGGGEPPAPGPKPVEPAPPVAAEAASKEKEPRSEAYQRTADALAAYGEKKLAATQTTEVHKDTIQFTASMISSLKKMRSDEYRNHLHIILKFDMPKEDIDSLNDGDLELLRTMELAKEVERSEKEIALSQSSGGERLTATAEAPPPPPDKGKEKREKAMQEAERILDEIHKQTMSRVDAGSVETLKDAIEALESVKPDVYRAHLTGFGLTVEMANTLTDDDIERLRRVESKQVREAFDKAEGLLKKERAAEQTPETNLRKRATELTRRIQTEINPKPAIVIPKKGIPTETITEIEELVEKYLRKKDPAHLDSIREKIK
jgi:hypothetical protein